LFEFEQGVRPPVSPSILGCCRRYVLEQFLVDQIRDEPKLLQCIPFRVDGHSVANRNESRKQQRPFLLSGVIELPLEDQFVVCDFGFNAEQIAGDMHLRSKHTPTF